MAMGREEVKTELSFAPELLNGRMEWPLVVLGKILGRFGGGVGFF